MAMDLREPCHSFKLLKDLAQNAHVKPTFKNQVVAALEYFEQQSLCDLDRRDQPQILRLRFHEFKNIIKNIPIFEGGGSKVDDAWRTARCFCHDVEPSTLLIASTERSPRKTAEEIYGKYEVRDFFLDLLKDYKSFVSAAKKRGLIVPETEETYVVLSLEILLISVDVPKMHRKFDLLRTSWEKIQPILDRCGLMDKFKGARSIQYRLKLFLQEGM